MALFLLSHDECQIKRDVIPAAQSRLSNDNVLYASRFIGKHGRNFFAVAIAEADHNNV